MSIITVGSTAALESALSSAHAGDTIKLQAGQYDGLAIKNLSFATDVTITSADPLHQAVLTNFTVQGVTGLTFSGVQMDSTAAVDQFGFLIKSSNDIHFDHVGVHGSLDNNDTNDGNGISFIGSNNISVTNSTFQQLGRAVGVGAGDTIKLTGNTVHDMRSDGFDFAQVSHVTVSNNNFTDFHKIATDHPDAIQFWTSGTTASSHDIVVSGNVITIGTGDGTQGIFFRDQVGTLAYQNVTITDNLVDGTGYNAIRLDHMQNLTLTNNNLVTIPGTNNQSWMLVENSDHVTSTNNQALSISFNGVTNLTESGDHLNTVQNDGGLATLTNWLASHSESTLLTNLENAFTPAAASSTQTAAAASTPVVTSTVVSSATNTAAAATAPVGAGQVMTSTQTSMTLSGNQDIDGTGNALNDSLVGNSGNNHLYGMAGNDTLDGLGGNDTLVGGAGNDTYYVNSGDVVTENANEGTDTVIARGDYTLSANVENLTINSTVTNGWSATGNDLANVITGNGGNNAIDGMAGNDTINGGAGNDTIIGNAGDDRLTGGAGVDIFRFAPHSGHDVVTDFGAGGEKDVLDISAYKAAGITATLQDVGSDLVIHFSSGDQITLLGVHQSQLVSTSTGWVF